MFLTIFGEIGVTALHIVKFTLKCSFSRFYLVKSQISINFAALQKNGSVVQLDRISDSGSEGCGFESLRSHWIKNVQLLQKG